MIALNPSKLYILFDTLKRINSVLPWRLRRSIVYVFIYMLSGGIIEMISILSLTLFFRLIYSPEFVLELPFIRELGGEYPAFGAILGDPLKIMFWGCIIPVGLIIIKNILISLTTWKSAILSEKVSAFIGTSIMEKYLAMPYSWHLSSQNAYAVLAMQRRFSLGNLLLNLLTAYSSLITVITLFGGLFIYSPIITIGAIISMFCISIVTFSLLDKNIDRCGKLSASAQEHESNATQTALSGVREIIIYQKQPIFLKEIRKHINDGMGPRTFLSISPTVPTWTLESGGFFLIWGTIYGMINFSNATHGEISETIALLALTAWRVLPAMNRLVGAMVSIKGVRPMAIPCLDYMESLKSDSPNLQIEPAKDFYPKEDIVFKDVNYTYPGTTSAALKNINCRIPLGTTVGIVGRSGSGKTTFINVLCGLLEPTSGQLLVDGHELTPPELVAYRKMVGYVPQSPFMLGGSAAENVALYDWGEKIDYDKVRASCDGAAIDFLGDAHEYADKIGCNALSGGQIQRVAIARALYTQPFLLIFDEATSALDQQAEAMIQHTILHNRVQCSNIIAAHRLETLEICDILIWLENGEIVKIGSAKEILANYRNDLLRSIDACKT